jgi:4-hydroxybenzoate polyprenyltransferase/phosphoserine phosphatase
MPESPAMVPSSVSLSPGGEVPLVVDLDGTLVKTDLLVESILALLRRNFFYLLIMPFWLLRGKAYLKRQISRRITLNIQALPYHGEFLAYLKAEQARGRPLVLATGSEERIARRVADHLGIFNQVLATLGDLNFSPSQKRERLVREWGEKGFDYAGNAWGDLGVWASARRAILVNTPGGLRRRAARVVEIERDFNGPGSRWKAYLRALRPSQWLKNLLVFVPLIMVQRYDDPGLVARAFLAFLSFGLCASSVYLVNDLVDLSADRRHPTKRKRPFAGGELPLFWGVASAPVLLGLGLLAGLLLPRLFLGMLLLYWAMNLAYSFSFKSLILADVVLLACLYTMRIMAGAASVGLWPSSWLLAFSTFLFFSLALVKRYDELGVMRRAEGDKARVRGYRVIDMELLASLGGGSGYVAVLVLALYISSGTAGVLYSRAYLLWFLCPLLLYWISYVWLIAHRGGMEDDPLVFTLRNWASRIVLILGAAILLLAR